MIWRLYGVVGRFSLRYEVNECFIFGFVFKFVFIVVDVFFGELLFYEYIVGFLLGFFVIGFVVDGVCILIVIIINGIECLLLIL